jgi:hypothetical protein
MLLYYQNIQFIMPAERENMIIKLYEYLKDENKTKEVGSKILKSMIIDLLRSKLGYMEQGITSWERRGPGWIDIGHPWGDVISPWKDVWEKVLSSNSEVNKTLSDLAVEVQLTDEELLIAKELGVLEKDKRD